LLVACAAGCGGGSETSAIPSGGESDQGSTAEAPAPEGCKAVDAPAAKPDGGRRKPKTKLDPAKTWVATVTTNCGAFEFELDLKKAPNAAASVAALANAKFFDGTVFHRIVPGFVIQGGDPTGSGTGGPGYKTVDKPPANTRYSRGVVAMAKGGDEAPGTAGSQFFVVTGSASQLTPDYAVLGRVTKGMEVVTRIGHLGDEQEQPTATVVIQRMRVAGS
jgi:cyclophilin family peptidyl-prolyl cis-trans isomerase